MFCLQEREKFCVRSQLDSYPPDSLYTLDIYSAYNLSLFFLYIFFFIIIALSLLVHFSIVIYLSYFYFCIFHFVATTPVRYHISWSKRDTITGMRVYKERREERRRPFTLHAKDKRPRAVVSR